MKKTLLIAILVLLFSGTNVNAKNLMHPLNERNVAIGLMPRPKYYPEVPRVTAVYAKYLYDQGQGFFIAVSTHDIQIVGGIQMTEREVWDTDFSKIKIPDNKIVFVY
ncbi:hypothetical protein [Trichloromonas acetexigens]|uniref:Uncharacterized protein n=1 Tax=Trichloromonas acetexigens TaxID=38815 RepID=A0A550JJH0_9BACT|nr:hypothetical protein [Desulfuromonas acetexigens]TRO83360.1 hypothetical protein FL622_04555 [Desulfuromonas acetexigens]